MEASETLLQLERIMNEFFGLPTSNDRKREIELLLSNFSNQDFAWRDCLGFLAATQNQYVSMYALTTVEKVICKRWVGMQGLEKTAIRTKLNEFLLKHHRTAPGFVIKKVIKLIVDIASTDWPHFYPDFFSNIMECIYRHDTLVLGLNMLLITSEELATPRDNVSSARKEELRRLLCSQVPQILSALTMVLEVLLPSFHRPELHGAANSKLKSASSATPPPSPSPSRQDDDSSDDDDEDEGITTSALLNVASSKILASELTCRRLSLPPDCDVIESVELCLKSLTHVFSWVPLTTAITSRLLSAVFHFAALGLHSRESSQERLCTYTNLAVLAMGTTNEIVYRHCVPADFEDFLLQMFQNTYKLLQMLVEPSNQAPGKSKLHHLDDLYIDKFTEFLHSFVRNHLRRFEGNSKFPIIEFLSLLFKYTFDQPRIESFLDCLEIWSVCIDYVTGVIASRSSADGQLMLNRYREALCALSLEVLAQTQFRRHQAKLEELDDKLLDDNEETEWQHYLRACIEVVLKVSDLLPDEVLQIVDANWKETLQAYVQIDKFVSGNKLIFANEMECLQWHCLLRDFSSILQLVGRLSVLFTGESFRERLAGGQEFINRLILISTYGSKNKVYALETQIPVLEDDLIEVQSQTLAALKAWSHWLAQLHNLSQSEAAYQSQCTDITSRIMVSVAPVLRDGAGRNKLVHSAVHFMVTLTGTVRPPSIWKLKEFTELYTGLHQLKLEPDDHLLMVRALANVLLLPWPAIPDQKWDDRARHLTKFLRDLTEPFRNLRTLPNFATSRELQEQAKPVIIHTLKIVGDLADNVLNENTPTKRLCHDCIREYIDIAQALFPIYVNDANVCEEIFSFFHVILDVLKTQMGAEQVEKIMDTFLTLFTESQLQNLLLMDGIGVRVVEKFLFILQFVVKENDASFRKFIDRALTHCLDVIYPLVADKPVADIKGPLFSVLFNVLLYNWRHFFRSSAVRTLMGGGQPGQHDQVLHQNHFLGIMQAFGQSFLQPDIAIFKQNLEALENLNAKWKLYQKPIFMENLIVEFLKVFLDVLERKSHDLLKEEIVLAVYNMASVSFDAFFNRFLSEYLDKTEGIDANQKSILKSAFKTDTDLPSFTTNIERFINDLRYYKLCNASIPSGSVNLIL